MKAASLLVFLLLWLFILSNLGRLFLSLCPFKCCQDPLFTFFITLRAYRWCWVSPYAVGSHLYALGAQICYQGISPYIETPLISHSQWISVCLLSISSAFTSLIPIQDTILSYMEMQQPSNWSSLFEFSNMILGFCFFVCLFFGTCACPFSSLPSCGTSSTNILSWP